MARLSERLPENVPGDLYVETFRTDSPAVMRKELEQCVAWMKTR